MDRIKTILQSPVSSLQSTHIYIYQAVEVYSTVLYAAQIHDRLTPLCLAYTQSTGPYRFQIGLAVALMVLFHTFVFKFDAHSHSFFCNAPLFFSINICFNSTT